VRLTDLLDHEVVDEGGQPVGVVHEVLLVQDGPQANGIDHALRLHGLELGQGGTSRRLGFVSGVVRGPWLLRVLLGRPSTRFVPWERVASVDDVITITGDGRDLGPRPSELG
jgi:sporulation protein YlmC with PRC-barrel domain